ncbi:MAG: dihydropteroate synthase [Candidatus Marinimicrobia bacterium]|nr:dihydropteroate synthase [Candidatus Neomarinimicrobiota bacterium]
MVNTIAVRIMGILNLTPDSFYDGGRYGDSGAALAHAEKMLEAGADIIDIGGESSRPGSESVSAETEFARVMPVLEKVCALGATVSVDTRKALVAEAALQCGALMVNDISALRFDPAMADVLVKYKAQIVLMHMKGQPRCMQEAPFYDDVMKEIRDFFTERIDFAQKAGIAKEAIILDPGIGFGKRCEDNITILKNIELFLDLGYPLMIGASRKRLIGDISGTPAAERLPGSLALACLAAIRGAGILRVHDVAETVQAIKVLKQLW